MLQYKRFCDKEEFVKSSTLQSVLFKVFRMVYLSSLNIRQWRRTCEVASISKLQLLIGFKQFWKLCLNIMSRKWLRFRCSRAVSLVTFCEAMLRYMQLLLCCFPSLWNFKLFSHFLLCCCFFSLILHQASCTVKPAFVSNLFS